MPSPQAAPWSWSPLSSALPTRSWWLISSPSTSIPTPSPSWTVQWRRPPTCSSPTSNTSSTLAATLPAASSPPWQQNTWCLWCLSSVVSRPSSWIWWTPTWRLPWDAFFGARSRISQVRFFIKDSFPIEMFTKYLGRCSRLYPRPSQQWGSASGHFQEGLLAPPRGPFGWQVGVGQHYHPSILGSSSDTSQWHQGHDRRGRQDQRKEDLTRDHPRHPDGHYFDGKVSYFCFRSFTKNSNGILHKERYLVPSSPSPWMISTMGCASFMRNQSCWSSTFSPKVSASQASKTIVLGQSHIGYTTKG